MIPKKIHYCWFGGNEKNSKTINLLKTFEKLKLHGYEVIEWNEKNYDVNKNSFLKRAYQNKKWAHVSDFARLDVLYEYGGIYLDTDIEVINNFDDLLNYSLFIGFMWDCNLGTAVIGAERKSKIIKEIQEKYLCSEISLESPNNDLFTRYFIDTFPEFLLNGKDQVLNDSKICILNRLSFEHPSLNRRNNYTIHHFSQSWKNNGKIKLFLKKTIISMMGLYLYRKYICKKSLKISPFYKKYLEDSK